MLSYQKNRMKSDIDSYNSSKIMSSIEPHTFATSWNSIRWRKSNDLSSKRFESLSKNFNNHLKFSCERSLSNDERKSRMNSVGSSLLDFYSTTPTNTKRFSTYSTQQDSKLRSDLFRSNRSINRNNVLSHNYTNHLSTVDSAYNEGECRFHRPTSYHHALNNRPSFSRNQDTERSVTSTNLPSSLLRKAERPWRQRMAETASLRRIHGHELGDVISSSIAASRSRRSSISSNHSGDELQLSLSALRSFVDRSRIQPNFTPYRQTSQLYSNDEYSNKTSSRSLGRTNIEQYKADYLLAHQASYNKMSRSYSPIRSKPTASLFSHRNSPTRLIQARSNQDTIYHTSQLFETDLHYCTENPARKRLSDQYKTLLKERRKEVIDSSDSSSGTEDRAISREKRIKKLLRRKQPVVSVYINDRTANNDLSLRSCKGCERSPCRSEENHEDKVNDQAVKDPDETKNVIDTVEMQADNVKANNDRSHSLPIQKNAVKIGISSNENSIGEDISSEGPSTISSPLPAIEVHSTVSSEIDEALKMTANDEFEEYAVVAKFIPGKQKKKRQAPVPGVWKNPDQNEINVIQNRHLQRLFSNDQTSICFARLSIEIVSAQIFAAKCEEITTTKDLQALDLNENTLPVKKSHRNFATALKFLVKSQRSSATMSLSMDVSCNKIFKSKMSYCDAFCNFTHIENSRAELLLKLNAPSVATTVLMKTLKKALKSRKYSAKVLVTHASCFGQNFYAVAFSGNTLDGPKMWKKKSKLKNANKDYQNLKKKVNAINFDDQTESLCSSDKSFIPSISDNESNSESLNSKLIPPCKVHTVKPNRDFPHITTNAPCHKFVLNETINSINPENINTEFESNDTSSNQTVVNKSDGINYKNMVDVLIKPSSYVTNRQGNGKKPHEIRAEISTFNQSVFDKPRTQFEEQIQNRANKLRKSVLNTTIVTNSEGNQQQHQQVTPMTPTAEITMQLQSNKRQTSVDRLSNASDAPITYNFQMAANASSNQRHERYAAHIPHKSITDPSDKSAINRNKLEHSNVISIDDKIDRYRHNQQRTKFKEAIDYLDLIYEDLSKENEHGISDIPIRNNANNRTMKAHSINTARISATDRSDSHWLVKNRGPKSAVNNITHDESKRKNSKELESLDTKDYNGTSMDVEISETTVLQWPIKKLTYDKLDFTRKWLANDIKSWISSSKPDLVLNKSYKGDSDERSIGSCSAEVAAINSLDRRKRNRKTPDLVQNVQANGISNKRQKHGIKNLKQNQITAVPIRPQALRPVQLQNSLLCNAHSNRSAAFHQLDSTKSCNSPLREHSYCQRRDSSLDRHLERKRSVDLSSWKTTPQNAYSTLGSVRSDGSPYGVNGAFVYYQAKSSCERVNFGGTNGSRIQTHLCPHDPLLAMDALVAELDLNTDQESNVPKRSSFPTAMNHTLDSSSYSSIYSEKCERFPWKNRYTLHKQSSPVSIKKASLDEVASMLQNIAGDMSSEKKVSSKSTAVLSPFEIINKERLNPSKVEAIQSLFEKKQEAKWQRENSKQIMSTDVTKNDKTVDVRSDKIPYSYSKVIRRQLTTKSGCNSNQRSTFVHDTPFSNPSNQISHQTGGYHSSGSSMGAPSSSMPYLNPKRSSPASKQSISSHAHSMEDDDDGFYDNLKEDDRRFSHFSEMDSSSIASHRPPPPSKSSNRFGQFLRKIGTPKTSSSASLLSLNKVANDKASNRVPLMKSNSLSNDPWKICAMQNKGTKKPGLGQLIRSSIFGSKKGL